MPTYDYTCENCGHRLEAFQKITSDPLTTCPKCHKEALRRGPGGGIGLSFKGSGFYITDYKSPPKSDSKDSSPKKEPQSKNDSPKGCCPCGKNKKECS
ncbi:FmdB family zinc ribbon protein [Criblamydia sequanensis]|uniref:Putative regulatory protein FmdB zinc ribbon domain-containing protein n=1 Tax=Candidatus Criblamydia sequanensis CRIB-18 TaxID=1437425 RepID=A0A090D2M3_9BACT|nr:FmdB family zinc ribbon protein [Criblamydia sequanensis]CDR34508.1 Conserved hypothetical protein [Criblamydia sequanensis CRIB-18]